MIRAPLRGARTQAPSRNAHYASPLLVALALLALCPSSAFPRGLALETAPWFSPTYSDSTLTLLLGATYAQGDTQAAVFSAALAPLRRGPLRIALTWSYVSVRTSHERIFGTGDPKLYARLRLYGSPAVTLRIEAAARLPLADASLFPYASGAQDLELGGNLGGGGPLGLVAGASRIWSEPPSRSTLRHRDVPHATHVWALVSRARGAIVVAARGDGLLFSHGGSRRIVEVSLAHLEPQGLHVEISAGFEIGPASDRVFDRRASLRFGAPLR